MSMTEEIPLKLDFSMICRCCLYEKSANGKLKPLFGSALDSMLREVTGLDQVTEGDDLPQQICVQCVLQVGHLPDKYRPSCTPSVIQIILQISRAYTLRMQCEKSDNILRRYLAREAKTDTQEGVISTVVVEVAQQQQNQFVIDLTADPFIRLIVPAETEYTESQSAESPSNPTDVQARMQILEEAEGDDSDEIEVGQEMYGEEDDIDISLNVNDGDCESAAATDEDDDDEEEMPDTNDIYGEVLDELNSMVAAAAVAATSDTNRNFLDTPANPSTSTLAVVKGQSFVCDKCKMTYDNQAALTYHQQKAHPPRNNPIECDVCGKSFRAQKPLRRHMKTHFAKKPHDCLTCGASFADKSNLGKHMKSHTGELRNVKGQPLSCDDCGKRFKWATSLIKHRKYHTGRNLHRCLKPECGKVFSEAKGLQVHLRSHSRETPFTCSVCGHRFNQAANLKKHQHLHSGVRPFACEICSRTFNQSHHLSDHMNTHRRRDRPRTRGMTSQRCQNCSTVFSTGAQLRRHVKMCLDPNTADHQAMAMLRDELLAEMEGRERAGQSVEEEIE